MSEEDLLLRAKEWLQEKEEILREKERQIEILNKEKQLLLKEIKPIEAWLREIQGEESDTTLEETDTTLEETNTTSEENIILRGDDLRNEVVAILEEVYPEGLYYKEILERINNKGYIVMGKDPGLNLIAHLTKETRVEKTGKRGVYKKSDK